MKIAICEDDRLCREALLALLEQYRIEKLPALSISSFSRADELLKNLEYSEEYEIYILDVLMPGMNGIELGKQLREHSADCRIFYLSSSREYAVDAFKVQASDYLLKPVNKDELFAMLDKVTAQLSEKLEKKLLVRSKDSNQMINYDNIQYAELDGKNIVYHLTSGTSVTGPAIRTSFAEAAQELLNDRRFKLCGPSKLVNLHHITCVESDALVFRNGVKLYISKRASREMLSVWSDFWFNAEV